MEIVFGGDPILEFVTDHGQGKQQVRVLRGLLGQNFELHPRSGHIVFCEQACVLQAQPGSRGVRLQGLLNASQRVRLALDAAQLRLQNQRLLLIGLAREYRRQARHGDLGLLRLVSHQRVGQQQGHVVAQVFVQQRLHRAIECGLLWRGQGFIAVQQHGESRGLAAARDDRQVRQGFAGAPLMCQQGRQRVVSFYAGGFYFRPQAHGAKRFALAPHILRKMGGIRAHGRVAQRLGLFQIGCQRGVEIAPTQGEFGEQQRVHRGLGYGSFDGRRGGRLGRCHGCGGRAVDIDPFLIGQPAIGPLSVRRASGQ